MRVNGGNAFWRILLILFSALLLVVFFAECTAKVRREQRMERILETAVAAATEFSVPLPMILAVMEAESDFHPEAVSDAGACGLMQLMPDTFRFVRDECLSEQLSDTAIFDPTVNIRYGTYYLSYLLAQFESPPTALAAYNAGEGRVAEWLKDPALSKDGQLTVIPFPETAAYVKKVLAAYENYDQKYSNTY